MESEGAKVMNSGKIANRWLVLTLVVFLAVAVSGAALSAELSDDEIYTVAQGEVVDDDLYVGANEIYINGIVKGDLIAGAQYIEIGPTGGHRRRPLGGVVTASLSRGQCWTICALRAPASKFPVWSGTMPS